MAQGTPTDLINDIKTNYFTGKLGEIKTSILAPKVGKLEQLGSGGENHWKLKTDTSQASDNANGWNDWEDFLNNNNADLSQETNKNEFERRKGAVLLCLARIVITEAKQKQDDETNVTIKVQWWNEIDNYVKTHTNPNEQTVYNDAGNTYDNYKKLLADMKVAGTTTTTTTTSTAGKGWESVGFCQKYLGNDPNEWKKVGLGQKYYG
jgi:hypothetical protein